MFDKSQLNELFKSNASGIRPSTGHEQRIRLLYERQLHRRNRSRFGGKRRSVLLKVSVAILVLAIISGFTGYYYFKISDQRVSFTYQQPVSALMDAATSARIYGMLKEIEAGLEAGESAVVYVPELAKLYSRKLALVSVMRPESETDEKRWEAEMAAAGDDDMLTRAMLPDMSAIGWFFDRGQPQPPFGGRISEREAGWLAELERESEVSGGGTAWRIKLPDSEESHSRVYTSFYRNAAQEELYVSVEIVDRKTDYRFMSSLAETEEVGLNGEKAYYLRTEPFMFAESNMHHQMQWLKSAGDSTWVYSIGSVSPEVGKAELLRMAIKWTQTQPYCERTESKAYGSELASTAACFNDKGDLGE